MYSAEQYGRFGAYYFGKKDACDKGRRHTPDGEIIEMRLTFDECFSIWEQSGQLFNWGNTKGKYVLARKNDCGHYEIGNVFIQSHSDNVADSWKRNPAMHGKLAGKPQPETAARHLKNRQQREALFKERITDLTVIRTSKGSVNIAATLKANGLSKRERAFLEAHLKSSKE